MDDDLIYWIWLTQIKGIGPIISRILIDRFKEPIEIYKASFNEFIEIKGIGKSIAEVILNRNDKLQSVSQDELDTEVFARLSQEIMEQLEQPQKTFKINDWSELYKAVAQMDF